MSRTWFTADTHFGQANIIRLCNRPFSSVDEMNSALVDGINAVVMPDDVLWHLGDFAFRNAQAAAEFRRRINAKAVHLVYGNHDSDEIRRSALWASSQAYAEITVDGQRLVLSHYAFRVWNRSSRGAIHLYGHSHGNLPGDSQSCDVGVDAWPRFRPVRLTDIMGQLATLPPRYPVDHHGAKESST